MSNYLSVEDLSKSIGDLILFEEVTFGINLGDRVGLVAKNGTGKSQLFSLLEGREIADTGRVVFNKEIHPAFLSQAPDIESDITVLEAAFEIKTPRFEVYSSFQEAEKRGDNAAIEALLTEMETHQAWTLDADVREMLSKLGLQHKLDAQVGVLSGGEKKRLALAKVLLEAPDILFLDEPTNHLDIDTIDWLQSFLIQQKFTLFVISHDRYFLDKLCTEVMELEGKRLQKYSGNYSKYLETKALRMETQEVEHHRLKQLYKKELEWMRRQPKARTTKSKSRIDSFKEVKTEFKSHSVDREMQMHVQMERLGSKIMELHHLNLAFGDQVILKDFSYTFRQKERIGIVGANGVGKPTFLEVLCQTQPTDTGKVIHGETLKIGYYRQSDIDLKEEKTLLETITDIAEYIPLKKGKILTAGQLLEHFLFERSRHFQKVQSLSGGQKKRLYLLTILMSNPNFLILDEPTNDLDVQTIQILESFLEDFPGVVVVISHDRFFLDKVSQQLFVFLGSGEIKNFPGNYKEYKEWHKQWLAEQQVIKDSEKADKKAKQKPLDRAPKLSFEDQKRIKQIETRLHTIAEQKVKLEQSMSSPHIAPDAIEGLSIEYTELKAEEEKLETEWLELQE